ncbi:MAG: DUF305 domain-containing protein [Pseudonocardiales bacterium]|nr:DUF305 domain-containing protein [Pseudonocardiales bacterium]
MRIHRVVGMLAVAVTAWGLLAGCGSKTTPNPAPTPPRATSSAAANPQQQHNQADVVFLQNMIPHQARAIAMSQMASNQTTSPQVKDLATRITTEQSPQTQQMSDLLTAWGAPLPATPAGIGTMGGLGHGQAPATMGGTGFDRMFLQTMIVHHQDAVTMSQTELTLGSNPATRNLAQQIISAQQAQISEMQALLQVI